MRHHVSCYAIHVDTTSGTEVEVQIDPFSAFPRTYGGLNLTYRQNKILLNLPIPKQCILALLY